MLQFIILAASQHDHDIVQNGLAHFFDSIKCCWQDLHYDSLSSFPLNINSFSIYKSFDPWYQTGFHFYRISSVIYTTMTFFLWRNILVWVVYDPATVADMSVLLWPRCSQMIQRRSSNFTLGNLLPVVFSSNIYKFYLGITCNR